MSLFLKLSILRQHQRISPTGNSVESLLTTVPGTCIIQSLAEFLKIVQDVHRTVIPNYLLPTLAPVPGTPYSTVIP